MSCALLAMLSPVVGMAHKDAYRPCISADGTAYHPCISADAFLVLFKVALLPCWSNLC